MRYEICSLWFPEICVDFEVLFWLINNDFLTISFSMLTLLSLNFILSFVWHFRSLFIILSDLTFPTLYEIFFLLVNYKEKWNYQEEKYFNSEKHGCCIVILSCRCFWYFGHLSRIYLFKSGLDFVEIITFVS